MELRVLGYFLVVAREENFTRAAEQLHVTQPTLSLVGLPLIFAVSDIAESNIAAVIACFCVY